MQMTVFGTTGRTGRKVVKQALARGHRVVALCRTVGTLGIEHPNLKTFEGQLTNPQAVERARGARR
jgi:uncharacterized protein YbjT (DUF2867 family)